MPQSSGRISVVATEVAPELTSTLSASISIRKKALTCSKLSNLEKLHGKFTEFRTIAYPIIHLKVEIEVL